MFPYSSAILPVLLWRPKAGHPVQIGSCVLLKIGSRAVLVTAAHVTDLRIEGSLCVPSSRGATKFVGAIKEFTLESGSKRGGDQIDISFMIPTDEQGAEILAKYAPVPPSAVCLGAPVREGEFCLIAGFPLSRKWTKHKDGEVFGSHLNFVGVAASEGVCQQLGFDLRENILIEYCLDSAVYPEGDRANPPSPRGMSGGGVFRVAPDSSGNPDSSTAVLVGVMHTFIERENIFVATSIRKALSLFVDSLDDSMRKRLEG